MDEADRLKFEEFLAQKRGDRARQAALSFDQVLALADKDLVGEVGLRVAIKSGHRGRDGLSDAERHVLLACGLRDEVKNGGFEQFFFNRSEDIEATDEALKLIGLRSLRARFRHALAAFPVWADWMKKRLEAETVDGLGMFDGFERSADPRAADAEFDAQCALYVRSNRDAFDLPPHEPILI